MKNKQFQIFYAEKLTSCVWLFSIFPYFLRKVLKRSAVADRAQHKKDILLYYLEASWAGLVVSRLTSIGLRIYFEQLNFNMAEMRDENNNSIWWNVLFEDSVSIQGHFRGHPEFQKIIKEYQQENETLLFLIRRLLVFDDDHFALIRILLFIQAASQMCDFKRKESVKIFLLSSKRPWLKEAGEWARKRNIDIIPAGGGFDFNIKSVILRSQRAKCFIKKVLYIKMALKFKIRQAVSPKKENVVGNVLRINKAQSNTTNLLQKLAVEFYGHLNFSSPILHSDLFFLKKSGISNQNVLIYFSHPAYPITEKKWGEIKENGMSAVVTNCRATTTPNVPVFNYDSLRSKINCSKLDSCNSDDLSIRKDLREQVADYRQQCNYWVNFFDKYNIKTHVTWYRHEAKCFPVADALKKTGGIGAIYQRSFEHVSSPWIVAATDVVFGFSRKMLQIGKDSHSVIPYVVITGYLGDYRFSFVQKDAELIRGRLQSRGVERILTYFDEYSSDDERWGLGHRTTQENYEYLLNKVLENPKIGLIIKPKVSGTLKNRLAGIYSLLQQAQNEGRCFVFDEGDLLGAHPPATAALAADVAIHGHLLGGTAGVEAALTGTPTLMLDREGWSKSPLHRLEEGKVIFKNWDDLWKACMDHWNVPGGVPGFGDWSVMINDIDPFRDGRAAERMGTYLAWLMEGFKAKLPRETILADAAERYTKIWGKDKVFSVNHGLRESVLTNEEEAFSSKESSLS